MQENLVIVESPAKAKTIEKFLGENFIVRSSFGHIRDLAKKDLGIHVDQGFAPIYEIPADKKKVVSELSKLAQMLLMQLMLLSRNLWMLLTTTSPHLKESPTSTSLCL